MEQVNLVQRVLSTAIRTVNATANKLEDLQRKQFDSGKDATGKQRKPYAASTQRYKRKKGQPTNRVTLKDSGDSYKSVKVKADIKGIEIDVPTTQFEYMVKKYGDDTIGIEPQALKQYFEQTVLTQIRNEFA